MCSNIHSDGTFKTAPRYFKQSYTIHGWSSNTGKTDSTNSHKSAYFSFCVSLTELKTIKHL